MDGVIEDVGVIDGVVVGVIEDVGVGVAPDWHKHSSKLTLYVLSQQPSQSNLM
jgi:hypothetical protein